MPRLTEVEKLATSDSSGGRARSPKKRKYHLAPDLSPGRTRGQTTRLDIASSALLQIGNLNSGNQPGANAPDESARTPGVSNLNSGSQLASDEKMFLDLPDEWKIKNTIEMKTKEEGNRLIDVKQLQDIVSNHFCCKSCIPRAIKTYLQSFFDYSDNQMREMRAEGNKTYDTSEKVHFYEQEMRSVRDLYQQFTAKEGKKKESTREEKLSEATNISDITTIGLATELTFTCECRRHFKDTKLRPHVASVIPTRISNERNGFLCQLPCEP